MDRTNATVHPAPSAPAASVFEARLVQRALTYLAALHGDDQQRATHAHTQSQRWRALHPRHEAAWDDALRRWDAVQRLSPRLRDALVPEARIPAPSRRRALQAGSAGIVAGLAGWLGWSGWQSPTYETRIATLRAQHLNAFNLPDGSTLDLAADSTLQVTMWRDRREVRLAHGRVRFDVAHDAERPFTVLTRLGRIEVLGTAFTVVDRGQGVHVDVERGHVRVVVSASGRSTQTDLRAGDATVIGDDGLLAPQPIHAGSRDAAAWRTGWWSFIDTPLAEAAAEVNAYLRTPLDVQAQAGRLRITGSFRIDRPQVFIDTLPKVLPVRVTVAGPSQRIEMR